MNKRVLKSMAGAMALTLAAGLAQASDNNQDVYLRMVDVNSYLTKGNAKLASANTVTNPPSACVNPQQGYACAAIAQLDQAHGAALTTLFRIDSIEVGQESSALPRRLGRVAWTAGENRELLAGIISPEYAGIISPEYAGIISPEYAGIISPDRTWELQEVIGPAYEGISAAEREAIDVELDAIIARAEADLVLAHAMRRALDGQY